MSAFATLRKEFTPNWTTIIVGWRGLGVLSPWPAHLSDFPPLLSTDEITVFANERLAVSEDAVEDDLIVRLLSLNMGDEPREIVAEHLAPLSDLCGGSSVLELRKWRVVLLEELLAHIPCEPLYGLMALSEFWQGLGFPSDGPHEVQGRESKLSPGDYYQESNYQRMIERHKVWIGEEKAMLGASRGNDTGLACRSDDHG